MRYHINQNLSENANTCFIDPRFSFNDNLLL